MLELKRGGYDPTYARVEIALELLHSTLQDIPFIIVSGTIGEDRAVSAMKLGAHDYILKGHLKRLVPAVARPRHSDCPAHA